MSARETGDLPRCALCGSLNGIIDRQVMLLSITRGPGHRELWSVMACERCAVAVVEKNTGDGAQVHAPLAASTPTTAPPPASPEPAREAREGLREIATAALNALPNIDPYDDDAHLVDLVLRDLRFARAIDKYAPHFAPKVRVKLPERADWIHESESAMQGVAERDRQWIAALRQAGVEIEGEPDVS